MNIHEYQAKQLLKARGIPVLNGGVALTVAEAEIKEPLAAFAGTPTTSVAVRLAPLAVAPGQLQLTGPLPVQLPPASAPAETKLVPAGSGSVTATSVAASGPVLVTTAA